MAAAQRADCREQALASARSPLGILGPLSPLIMLEFSPCARHCPQRRQRTRLSSTARKSIRSRPRLVLPFDKMGRQISPRRLAACSDWSGHRLGQKAGRASLARGCHAPDGVPDVIGDQEGTGFVDCHPDRSTARFAVRIEESREDRSQFGSRRGFLVRRLAYSHVAVLEWAA
jgi:hypothetical protein